LGVSALVGRRFFVRIPQRFDCRGAIAALGRLADHAYREARKDGIGQPLSHRGNSVAAVCGDGVTQINAVVRTR
jgi:hypothetical protein